MPNITGKNYEDTRNRYVEYSGMATTATQTFTFDRIQDGMAFRNKGKVFVTLTVSNKTYNIPPNAVINIDDKTFISFDVRTQSGSHPFEVKAFAQKGKSSGGSDAELREEFEIFKSNTTSQLAQKVDEVVLENGFLRFYAKGKIVKSVSVVEAGNSQTIQDYIDTLVLNGQIEGVTLTEGAVSPENTNFITIGKNLFNQKYERFMITTVGETISNVRSSETARMVVLPLKAGETYSFKVFDTNDRMRAILTNSLPHDNMGFDFGFEVITIDDSKKSFTFTNVNGYKYIFVHVSSSSQEPRVQVELGNVSTEFEPYKATLKDEINFSVGIDKVDFIEGLNLFDGQYSDITVSNSLVARVPNPDYYRRVLIELEPFKTYDIEIVGTHNRFNLDVGNSIDIGSSITRIVEPTLHVRNYTKYSFTNTSDYKYMFIGLAYAEPITPEIYNAEVYIYDSDSLRIAGEEVLRKKANSIPGELLKDKSIPATKIDFDISGYSDLYIADLSDEAPHNLHTEVYTHYDNLVSLYPQYVSKSVLGTDMWGSEIREYVFKTPNYNSRIAPRNIDTEIVKPKILITTGVHGTEKGVVFSTYKFIKDLCKNKSISKMGMLREAVEFRVIPVAVPTAYDNYQRHNNNGVNINRNFDAGWVAIGNPGDYDYSGSSPASEKETQIIQNWLNTHSDGIFYLDFHNTGFTDEEVTYLSAKVGTTYERKIKDAYFMCINKLSQHWRNDFGIPESQNLGYTGEFTFAGSQAFGDSLNIPSMTPELSVTQIHAGGSTRFDSVTNAIAQEFIGNFLLSLSKDYVS